MLTWPQSAFLAVLQGFAELFPISSLGHTVILPALLGWGPVQRDPTFVPFVVLLHIATAAALLLFYKEEWIRVVRAFVTSAIRGRLSHTSDEQLAWMLFFGTLPTALLGFLLESTVKQLFATPFVAALFLAVNGIVMLVTERIRRRSQAETTVPALREVADEKEGRPVSALSRRGIQDLGWRDAVIVGSTQSLALIPGISRSGVTMCAGLLVGMHHDEAAHYAFMLATPIIAAAGILEVPALFGAGGELLAMALVGAALAGVTAYLSVRYLTRYFRVGRLDPFAYYCLAAGLASLVYVVLRSA